MENNNPKKIERKSFFKTIGFGTLGISLASMLPLNLFGKEKPIVRNIKVKTHPSAVKRNK